MTESAQSLWVALFPEWTISYVRFLRRVQVVRPCELRQQTHVRVIKLNHGRVADSLHQYSLHSIAMKCSRRSTFLIDTHTNSKKPAMRRQVRGTR